MMQVALEHNRLTQLNTRIATAKQKVEQLATRRTDVTYLKAAPKYPIPKEIPGYRSLFEGMPYTPEPFDLPPLSSSAPDGGAGKEGEEKDETQDDEEVHPTLRVGDERGLNAYHPQSQRELAYLYAQVRLRETPEERRAEVTVPKGLGSLPPTLRSVAGMLLLNSSENPYHQYPGAFDNLTSSKDGGRNGASGRDGAAELDEAPETLREGGDMPAVSGLEYTFRPRAPEEEHQFEFSTNLDLPNVADIAWRETPAAGGGGAGGGGGVGDDVDDELAGLLPDIDGLTGGNDSMAMEAQLIPSAFLQSMPQLPSITDYAPPAPAPSAAGAPSPAAAGASSTHPPPPESVDPPPPPPPPRNPHAAEVPPPATQQPAEVEPPPAPPAGGGPSQEHHTSVAPPPAPVDEKATEDVPKEEDPQDAPPPPSAGGGMGSLLEQIRATKKTQLKSAKKAPPTPSPAKKKKGIAEEEEEEEDTSGPSLNPMMNAILRMRQAMRARRKAITGNDDGDGEGSKPADDGISVAALRAKRQQGAGESGIAPPPLRRRLSTTSEVSDVSDVSESGSSSSSASLEKEPSKPATAPVHSSGVSAVASPRRGQTRPALSPTLSRRNTGMFGQVEHNPAMRAVTASVLGSEAPGGGDDSGSDSDASWD